MQRRTFLSAAAACSVAPGLRAATEMKGQIKITGIETDRLRHPPGRPYWDAIHEFGRGSGGVVLRITTNAGITGWAYSSFGMIDGGTKVVETILQAEIKNGLGGQDPAF